jgi:hypothetical protein
LTLFSKISWGVIGEPRPRSSNGIFLEAKMPF